MSAACWEYQDFWQYLKAADPSIQRQMAKQVDAIMVEMLPKLTNKWRVEVLFNAPDAVIESLYKRNIITKETIDVLANRGRMITLIAVEY